LPIAVISGAYLQTSGLIYFIEVEEGIVFFMDDLKWMHNLYFNINDTKIILKKKELLMR
jgi:hypothetical protein